MKKTTLIRNPLVHVVRCVDAHGQPPVPGMPWLVVDKLYEVNYITASDNTLKVFVLNGSLGGIALNACRFVPVADYCLN